MRTILVVQEKNLLCEEIIRRQFKEEIATGKVEIEFISPEELVDTWEAHGRNWFCVKRKHHKFRIFAVNMEPPIPVAFQTFSATALDPIQKLRLQFRRKKVIAGFNSAAICLPPTRQHQPDLVCTASTLKSALNSQYGWIK